MDDPDTMIRAAVMLLEHGRLAASGVAVLSSSGGGLSIALDRVVEAGFEVPRLAAKTAESLGEHVLLPADVAAVDVGRRRIPGGSVALGEIATSLASDPEVGVVLYCATVMPYMVERTLEAEEGVRAVGKPFLPTLLPGSAGDGVRAGLRAKGIECFDHLDDALRLIRVWMSAAAAAPSPGRVDGRVGSADAIANLQALPAGELTEQEAKEVLNWYGIASNAGQGVNSPEEAVAAGEVIGYPVALKVASRKLTHKSDVGGVRLDLADSSELSAAYKELEGPMRNLDHEATFLVQAMAPPGLELLVGLTRDEQFGAVVTVGLGGTLTEFLRDVAVAVAPVSESTALDMLRQLKTWPLLQGARVYCEADLDALASTISRLSWIGVDLGSRLVEFEINPLIVLPRGSGVVAVDGRGTLR